MTQTNIVKRKLADDGVVTRNWALKNYISRLGAIINKLRGEGWEIEEGEYVTTGYGKDYQYKLIKGNIKKVYYKNEQGIIMATRYEETNT